MFVLLKEGSSKLPPENGSGSVRVVGVLYFFYEMELYFRLIIFKLQLYENTFPLLVIPLILCSKNVIAPNIGLFVGLHISFKPVIAIKQVVVGKMLQDVYLE